MLPMWSAGSSSAEKEKMMSRHGYGGSNGYAGGAGAYPRLGGSEAGFSIRPDKYEKYQPRTSRHILNGRRGTLVRVGGALAAVFFILMIVYPSLRPAAILGPLSLSLFSGGEAFNIETVRYYDLSNVGGTSRGWEREERILLCAPLRDASPHLPMFFSHLRNLTYPHNLIDLAFLVGDSKDNTLPLLSDLLAELQGVDDPKQAFGEISVLEKDFGQKVDQDVESRHGFAAQASRRKSMAQARNWLLSAALRPTHSWVYWRDVDVETAPFTILEDLMRHNKDVIVPNVWRPLPDWLGGEQPYDLNSWQESETALALADTLDEDAVIVEGYAEYATWRPHLAYLRDPYGDPDMEMEIDGVGGVSILAKARVFRSGVHFPAFSFEKHAETEGFGKMAKRMQFSVVGLPHYTVWHLYEPSVDDIRHMEEMEQERIQREKEELERKERMEKIQNQFDDTASQWEKDKDEIREITKKDFVAKQALEEKEASEVGETRLEKMHILDPMGEIPEGSQQLEVKVRRPIKKQPAEDDVEAGKEKEKPVKNGDAVADKEKSVQEDVDTTAAKKDQKPVKEDSDAVTDAKKSPVDEEVDTAAAAAAAAAAAKKKNSAAVPVEELGAAVGKPAAKAGAEKAQIVLDADAETEAAKIDAEKTKVDADALDKEFKKKAGKIDDAGAGAGKKAKAAKGVEVDDERVAGPQLENEAQEPVLGSGKKAKLVNAEVDDVDAPTPKKQKVVKADVDADDLELGVVSKKGKAQLADAEEIDAEVGKKGKAAKAGTEDVDSEIVKKTKSSKATSNDDVDTEIVKESKDSKAIAADADIETVKKDGAVKAEAGDADDTVANVIKKSKDSKAADEDTGAESVKSSKNSKASADEGESTDDAKKATEITPKVDAKREDSVKSTEDDESAGEKRADDDDKKGKGKNDAEGEKQSQTSSEESAAAAEEQRQEESQQEQEEEQEEQQEQQEDEYWSDEEEGPPQFHFPKLRKPPTDRGQYY